MTKTYKVAVVGATGNVGREMLSILSARKFPASEVIALASNDSVGREVSYGDDKTLKVQALEHYDFKGTQIALFSPGAKVSAIYAPKAAEAKCVVIDNTSHFRNDKDVPLIVPEVNAAKIADFRTKYIIANPNCSTIQMVVALKPLNDIAKIKRVVVSTYQSVSGAGRDGMDALFNQTRGTFTHEDANENTFTKPIAFNLIPHIDAFMDDGMTKEEWKMMMETKKILGDDTIQVMATCVRVPVFLSHSESVNVEFHTPISEEKARKALSMAPGIKVVDAREDGGYITPKEAAGQDAVFVSRLRRDPTVANGLAFWCVADNLRKGAALNAVQIAEELIKNYL